jgi:SM-20-related protein
MMGNVQWSGRSVVRQPEGGVAVLEIPRIAPAECVVFDEFLAPAEVNDLIEYALAHEQEFRVSQVVSPGIHGGSVDFEYRRSRVLMDLGRHDDVIVNRIQSSLPRILQKLGIEPFSVSRIEAQMTSSGDGDFFRWHTDDGHAEVASRQVTFVYFLHREPKAFRGGDLRIYESELQNGSYRPTRNRRTIVPQQNQAVFFASALAHEITPVECPSGAFADSRFTVNGWFHR